MRMFPIPRLRLAILALLLGMAARALAADAVPDAAAEPPPSSAAARTPSESLTINLIHRLVARGALSQEDADALIQQAEQETAEARARAREQTIVQASRPADAASPGPVVSSEAPPASDGEVRVTYVPDVVKEQMREEIKADVMEQARNENWASPRALPGWLSRVTLFSDIRARYEGDYYPSSNVSDGGGNFLNFNAINTGSPLHITTTSTGPISSPPYIDVDQDRDRIRLRARFGLTADLGDGFSLGFRIATGQDNSPTTENQSLGAANGAQGGNFSKYAIWLDRGFIRYEVGAGKDVDLSVMVGRFDNPFFHTSMIWADDLGFDGLAVQGKIKATDGVTPFFAAGAFPVFNTDLNFSSIQTDKYQSEDKWLFAVQAGTDWQIRDDLKLKAAVAYYEFQNIEGKVSSPMNVGDPSLQGDTDDSRPAFAQHGNTYIGLRQSDGTATTDEYQYFGLATPFHEVALTGRIDYARFDPLHLWMTAEMVDNVALNKSDVQNNGPTQFPGPANNVDGSLAYDGGGIGWLVAFNVGSPSLDKRWDWNVYMNYRYVESDATVDGFTDADFGGPSLIGTNLQGYTLGGNLALSSHVWAGARWMSADSIAGPSIKSDVFQIDLNARF